jgi:hypothetical protein
MKNTIANLRNVVYSAGLIGILAVASGCQTLTPPTEEQRLKSQSELDKNPWYERHRNEIEINKMFNSHDPYENVSIDVPLF